MDTVRHANHFTHSPILPLLLPKKNPEIVLGIQNLEDPKDRVIPRTTPKLWPEEGRKTGTGTPHLEFLINCLGFQAVPPSLSGVASLPKGYSKCLSPVSFT